MNILNVPEYDVTNVDGATLNSKDDALEVIVAAKITPSLAINQSWQGPGPDVRIVIPWDLIEELKARRDARKAKK